MFQKKAIKQVFFIAGVDPLGRPQSGNIGNNGNSNNFGNNGNNNNFDDAPQERFTSSCCCTPNNFCPSTNGQLGNGDEDGFVSNIQLTVR